MSVVEELPPNVVSSLVSRWRADSQLPQATRRPQAARKRPRQKHYRTYKVQEFARLAARFLENKAVRANRGEMLRFLAANGLATDRPTREALRRAVTRAKTGPVALARAKFPKIRRRSVGRQGVHLVKAPGLKEESFRWFCKVRSRVKGRMPLSVLRLKAQLLRKECVKAAVALGVKPTVLEVNSVWLWRFRKAYDISLRLPNRRWKLPRSVLLERLRIMWVNTIRLRTLALLLLGYDLDAHGWDQPPFHMSDSGSKHRKTSALRGAPAVALKELADQTRDRWTASTWTTSNPALALAGPPLEVL